MNTLKRPTAATDPASTVPKTGRGQSFAREATARRGRSPCFPQYGKLFAKFSTLWKTFFHTVENPAHADSNKQRAHVIHSMADEMRVQFAPVDHASKGQILAAINAAEQNMLNRVSRPSRIP